MIAGEGPGRSILYHRAGILMFGYVRPPVNALPQEELERFRRMYCGLCHTLSRRYGQAARFILNYDFTYLAILLSSGEEGRRSEARCYTSPLKKRAYLEPDAAMELAADESVILAYWQLRDGIADHGLVSGLKYRAGGGAFGARLSKGLPRCGRTLMMPFAGSLGF